MKDDVINKVRRVVFEEAMKASKEYMKKEIARQRLQDMTKDMILSGEIKDESELVEHWKTLIMAVDALKMVPMQAFKGSKQ